ncbi:MAG: glycosyltransferase family 4 protein [Chloroflexi bacterium]|nr:glycosyltransferase family 4 protein [Chloroflexota bacterium]
MKILQILYFYTPHCSGLTIYAERLGRELVARGHEVTILTSRFSDELPERENADGMRVVRVPTRAGFSRAVIMPGFLPEAARLMREHDVVHLHLPMAEATVLSMLGRAFRCRVIVTHHSDLVLDGTPLDRLAAGVALWSGVGAARVANRLVTYTHDRAAVSPTVTRAGTRVSVVPPPVTVSATSPERGRVFRDRHGFGNGPVVGFAGRFAVEKGIDVLLQTRFALRERWPDVMFALAGPYAGIDGEERIGPWQQALRDAGPAALRLGVLGGQELSDFYAACDVLVLPSVNWTETFGLVQVEAMLCGTPVVASDLPGVREPVLLTGMGRIAPPGDVAALGEAITAVLADLSRYRRSPAEIEARFSLPVTVSAYERLYRGETVELHRPGPCSAADVRDREVVR